LESPTSRRSGKQKREYEISASVNGGQDAACVRKEIRKQGDHQLRFIEVGERYCCPIKISNKIKVILDLVFLISFSLLWGKKVRMRGGFSPNFF